jgi:hypothetical protein
MYKPAMHCTVNGLALLLKYSKSSIPLINIKRCAYIYTVIMGTQQLDDAHFIYSFLSTTGFDHCCCHQIEYFYFSYWISQERDPIPLTIHHLPIAVTFAYFGEGNIVVCSCIL